MVEPRRRRRVRTSRDSPGHHERKLRQLCTQIGRAIDLTLQGDCDDEVLQNTSVHSVEPAAGNRILVTLVVHAPGSDLPKAEVMDRLERHRHVLMREIERAVSRRSVPEITFWLIKEESA
jgi:ribosome-binding factor A